MVVTNLDGAAPRLARIVGSVQRTPASASFGARLRRQFMVDAQQQREELRVLQEGMAHWNGLYSWSNRDSPTGIVDSRSLREIFYGTSCCLINSAANAIKILGRAQTTAKCPFLQALPRSP